ncbi:unnamed protein product [Prorocentrum cordatum]|uniref:Ribonucloprotein n=1 Tax=Prorocentrum cordatum TaxID=2364126 RepID=A0ABN9WM79_9DINO|nr:unnamed protein product [Polarella glacialis]
MSTLLPSAASAPQRPSCRAPRGSSLMSGSGGASARPKADRSRSQVRGNDTRKKPEDQDTHEDQQIDPKKAPIARVRRRRGAAYKPKAAPKIQNGMRDLILILLRATYRNTKKIRELKG